MIPPPRSSLVFPTTFPFPPVGLGRTPPISCPSGSWLLTGTPCSLLSSTRFHFADVTPSVVLYCRTFLFEGAKRLQNSILGSPEPQKPSPGPKGTPRRIQEDPEEAGSGRGGRVHDCHRCFRAPPENAEIVQMPILSAGPRDWGRAEWQMLESAAQGNKINTPGRTKIPNPYIPV